MQRSKRTNTVAGQNRPPPYFFAHPLAWWTRFDGECDVALIPWDVLGITEEQQLFMFQPVASWGYRFCSWFENKYPAEGGALVELSDSSVDEEDGCGLTPSTVVSQPCPPTRRPASPCSSLATTRG